MSRQHGFQRRKQRVRSSLAKKSYGRPRLSVFRSNCNMYVQLIDDAERKTIVCASTLEKECKAKLKTTCGIEAAQTIGKLIGERAIKAGIKEVVFDRGGYLYHGRVKALAEAVRETGLSF
jgi:large subunit ribosomal protein L18